MYLHSIYERGRYRGALRAGRLFASGFRIAFLAAGLSALVLIPLWIAVWAFGAPLESTWAPSVWHGHDMLFGFLGAAVAGFLLTAVPSWTGSKGFAGGPLVLLAVLWLLARVMLATSAHWPALLVATVDLAFPAVLCVLLAPPLLRNRNRNLPLLLVPTCCRPMPGPPGASRAPRRSSRRSGSRSGAASRPCASRSSGSCTSDIPGCRSSWP